MADKEYHVGDLDEPLAKALASFVKSKHTYLAIKKIVFLEDKFDDISEEMDRAKVLKRYGDPISGNIPDRIERYLSKLENARTGIKKGITNRYSQLETIFQNTAINSLSKEEVANKTPLLKLMNVKEEGFEPSGSATAESLYNRDVYELLFINTLAYAIPLIDSAQSPIMYSHKHPIIKNTAEQLSNDLAIELEVLDEMGLLDILERGKSEFAKFLAQRVKQVEKVLELLTFSNKRRERNIDLLRRIAKPGLKE